MSRKITIKTEKVLNVYRILNGAVYGKMADDDKIKVWHILRKLKPVATKFEEDLEDARKTFKKDFEKFDEKLENAQAYERATKDENADTSKLKMGAAEYDAFTKGDWSKYNELVLKAIKDFAQKEIKIDIEPISEDAFEKLITSNEFTFGQVELLEIIIK